jgi:hypothetical protein
MRVSAQTYNLLEHGPVVEAEIFSSEASFLQLKNFGTEENFAKVHLLIDTGSNISGLDRAFIHRLQLPSLAQKEEWADGPTGMWKVKRYCCVLYLPIFDTKALNIEVLEGDYQRSHIHGVLGRDILQYCHFLYDGKNNSFRLEAREF